MTIKGQNPSEEVERDLQQVLGNFRKCVQAWSDAEYGRAKERSPLAMRLNWRAAAAWALGCLVAAGTLGGGLEFWRHSHFAGGKHIAANLVQHAPITVAAVQQIPQMPHPGQAIAPARDPDANLLAQVDRDVSRAVPSAMEPLARLMEESETE